jgi:hypothetical protein
VSTFIHSRYGLLTYFVTGTVLLGWSFWPFTDSPTSDPIEMAISAPRAKAAVPIENDFDRDWAQVQRILSTKCAGCHRAGTELADLTSYHAVVAAKTEDGEPFVVPGDLEQSWLWEMVCWDHTGEQGDEMPDEPLMPLKKEISTPPENQRNWLSGAQLAAVERWIQNGAHEHR